MTKNNIHTVPHPDGWATVVEGNDRASKVFDTKAEALPYSNARAKADNVEHIIHNKDGKIANSDSHGNDPHPPKG